MGAKPKIDLVWAQLWLMMFATGTWAQSPPAITGISHIKLYADDIAQSRQFYTGLIGWQSIPAADSASGLRIYVNHAQYVELVTPSVHGQDRRLAAVAFATSNADALRRFLSAKGVAVPSSIDIEADGSRSFVVHDPEGNSVEFTQQGRAVPAPSPAAVARRLSTHIMHAGYEVHDRALLDHFYKDILGFRLYWQGGPKDGEIDWVMMQVPNGTDWIEYMLYLPSSPTRAQLGSADHMAPGVISVAQLQKSLEERGWTPPDNKNPQVFGHDGKLQLDLHDPDGTRIEFMEFKPTRPACCSLYTGKHPSPSDAW